MIFRPSMKLAILFSAVFLSSCGYVDFGKTLSPSQREQVNALVAADLGADLIVFAWNGRYLFPSSDDPSEVLLQYALGRFAFGVRCRAREGAVG